MRLTSRGRQCLIFVADGKTDEEIARLLGVSPRTVEYHVREVLRRLDVTTRAAAVNAAWRVGILRRSNQSSGQPRASGTINGSSAGAARRSGN